MSSQQHIMNQRQSDIEQNILSNEYFNGWVSDNEEQLFKMYEKMRYYNEKITEEQFLVFAFLKSKHSGYYQN